MSANDHVYTPPASTGAELPADVRAYLDGTGLIDKTQAVRLSTVNADGWPHAALLSAGDMLAVSSSTIRFVVFPQSASTGNLDREGRATATLALGGGMTELFLRTRRLHAETADVPLAFFEAEVERSRQHATPYADVTTGITFALHDAADVLPRWERQIAALTAL